MRRRRRLAARFVGGSGAAARPGSVAATGQPALPALTIGARSASLIGSSMASRRAKLSCASAVSAPGRRSQFMYSLAAICARSCASARAKGDRVRRVDDGELAHQLRALRRQPRGDGTTPVVRDDGVHRGAERIDHGHQIADQMRCLVGADVDRLRRRLKPRRSIAHAAVVAVNSASCRRPVNQKFREAVQRAAWGAPPAHPLLACRRMHARCRSSAILGSARRPSPQCRAFRRRRGLPLRRLQLAKLHDATGAGACDSSHASGMTKSPLRRIRLTAMSQCSFGDQHMNPLNILFNNPVSDVIRAVVMPFKFIFVVGLCWFINYMTFTGTWWVKVGRIRHGHRGAGGLGAVDQVAVCSCHRRCHRYFIYKRYGAGSEGEVRQLAQRRHAEAAG